MSKRKTRQERGAEEEVAFWRDFIHWWEATHNQAATARMREALRLAERRLEVARGIDVPPAELKERVTGACRFH